MDVFGKAQIQLVLVLTRALVSVPNRNFRETSADHRETVSQHDLRILSYTTDGLQTYLKSLGSLHAF